MTKVKVAAAVVSFAMLSACASTSTQESTGQYVDSSTITLKIKTQFLADNELKSFSITVKTFKGRVELSGFVDNAAQKHRADEIARHIEGVVSVTDAMVVKGS